MQRALPGPWGVLTAFPVIFPTCLQTNQILKLKGKFASASVSRIDSGSFAWTLLSSGGEFNATLLTRRYFPTDHGKFNQKEEKRQGQMVPPCL